MNENNTKPKQHSVGANMIFYTVGSMGYYFLIWLLSVLVVRISGYEAAGVFSVCMSVTSAPAVVALYNMRSFQVSDINGEYANRTYLNSRFVAFALSMLFCLGMVLFYGYDTRKGLIILAYMVVKGVEGVADVYYGIEQLWNRLDLSGISLMIRGVAASGAFVAALAITDDMFWAMLVMALASVAVVLIVDVPLRKKYEGIYQPEQKNIVGGSVWKLMAICTPLCIVGVLNNMTYTVPKIYLESFHGSEIMGYYASIASPTVVVQLVAQTLFAPVIPGLTEQYQQGHKKTFLGMIGKFAALAAGLTLVCVVGAHFLGEFVLVLLYGEDIRPYTYLFVPVIFVAVSAAVSSVLMYICTLLRIIIPQCIAGVVGIGLAVALSYIMIKNAANPMLATLLAIIIATVAYCLVSVILIWIKVHKMNVQDEDKTEKING